MYFMELSARFTGHKGSIYTVESLDESRFLTAGSEGIIAMWDISNPEEGSLLARIPGVVYSMFKLNEDLLLAGSSTGAIHVISLNEQREIRLLQYHQSHIFRIALWKQQKLIFSLDGHGIIQIYNPELNPVHSFSPLQGKLRSIAFSETSFFIGSPDGRILQYSKDFELINEYQAHQQGFGVNTLLYRDGILLSGSRDARLIISDPLAGKVLENIPAHNYAIYDIAEAPGPNQLIATASRDKTIKLWSLPDFEPVQRLDAAAGGHVNSVNDICWLDKNTLISAGDDRIAIAWKMQSQS